MWQTSGMADATPETTEHRVTMRDIQNLLAGEGGVDMRQVIEDGVPVGMRLVGVRPGTTAARLGGENDDLVESINDIPLDGVAAAYRAADAAIATGRVVLRGRRRGVPFVTVLVIET
jgi:hypothetical protein